MRHLSKSWWIYDLLNSDLVDTAGARLHGWLVCSVGGDRDSGEGAISRRGALFLGAGFPGIVNLTREGKMKRSCNFWQNDPATFVFDSDLQYLSLDSSHTFRSSIHLFPFISRVPFGTRDTS